MYKLQFLDETEIYAFDIEEVKDRTIPNLKKLRVDIFSEIYDLYPILEEIKKKDLSSFKVYACKNVAPDGYNANVITELIKEYVGYNSHIEIYFKEPDVENQKYARRWYMTFENNEILNKTKEKLEDIKVSEEALMLLFEEGEV